MSKRGNPLPGQRANAPNLKFGPMTRPAMVLAGAVILLAALAAYRNSFSVPFLFDDKPAIVDNTTIRHLWPPWQALSPPANGMTVNGRPLVNLSLAVNYALGGKKVWGYHAVNLAVHFLASLILFGIVRRTLLLHPDLRARFGAAALPLALAVAALWAVHPLQTESVTYVAQRAESLMGLFYLLTLYGLIRGIQSGAVGWYALAIGACLLGMATKEVMVSAPLLVWLYDRTFVTGSFRTALRRRWAVYTGLAAGWIVLAFLVARTGELGSERAGFHAAVAWRPYAITQLWAVAHYLGLSVWPHPLVLDYGRLLITRAAQILPSALLVATLAAGTLLSLRRWPALGFLGCWFFVILAPTSSVMPLAGQTVAEHRMYLSLAAVIALAVLLGYRLAGWQSLVLCLGLVAGFVVLTQRRNAEYRSAVTIWSDTVSRCPDNPRARYNFGSALLDEGRVDEAIFEFQEALTIEPLYVEAHNNLGLALLQKGRVAEAIGHYRKAVETQSDFAEARNNLAAALFQHGQVDEAIAEYRKCLETSPNLAAAHNSLGWALVQKGQVVQAIAHFQKALEIDPDDAAPCNNLAWVLATCPEPSVRDGARAVALAQRAERLSGGRDPVILGTLAAAYAESGRFQEAVATVQQAMQLAAAHGNTALANGLRIHLGLYQAGSPFRDTDQSPADTNRPPTGN